MWISDQDNRMMYNSNYLKSIRLDGFDIIVRDNEGEYLLATYDCANVALQVYEILQEMLVKKKDFVFQMPKFDT